MKTQTKVSIFLIITPVISTIMALLLLSFFQLQFIEKESILFIVVTISSLASLGAYLYDKLDKKSFV